MFFFNFAIFIKLLFRQHHFLTADPDAPQWADLYFTKIHWPFGAAYYGWGQYLSTFCAIDLHSDSYGLTTVFLIVEYHSIIILAGRKL